MALLEVDDVHLKMRTFEGDAHVLNGVSLTVDSGEIWGLVGETGSGKSLTGLSINGLIPSPPAIFTAGQIRYHGRNVLGLPESELRRLRGRRIAMVFQDPTTNLNPAFRISTQIVDVALHAAAVDPSVLGLPPGAGTRRKRAAAREAAIRMLDRVGIRDAAGRIDDYPHQFSGGMRQRVLIAMALIGRPELLVADEPTTALDVNAQAQILELIYDLVQEFRLGVLFVTHNLGVVARLCSHTAVLYGGTVVEAGVTRDVLTRPAHPYTRGLIASLPTMTTPRGSLKPIAGTVPAFWAPPGCPFVSRCPERREVCADARPPRHDLGNGHKVACIHAGAAAC